MPPIAPCPPATVTVDATSFTASLSLVKSTTSTGYTAAGQMIPYTYVVKNTGTISLTSVSVTDATTPGGHNHQRDVPGDSGQLSHREPARRVRHVYNDRCRRHRWVSDE